MKKMPSSIHKDIQTLQLVLRGYLGLHLSPRCQYHFFPPLLHQRLPLRLILTPGLPTGRPAGGSACSFLIVVVGCGELCPEVVSRNEVRLGWFWCLGPCACAGLRRRRRCSRWHWWSESLWRLYGVSCCAVAMMQSFEAI